MRRARLRWALLPALLFAAGCQSPSPAAEAPLPSTTTAAPSTAAPITSSTAERPPAPVASAPRTAPASWWRPPAHTTWQYQLSGSLDLTVPAQVYDVDGVETSAAQVRQLHEAGRRVLCYVNAGAHEDWRPDASAFPRAVLGSPLDGWPGERWLDIRRTDVLLPIMAARMDVCRAKGFDAVEPDNVDGYSNDTGFPLTAHDQVVYDTALARLAHDRGMSVGLKNDTDQVSVLEASFDFAVNEECMVYDECDAYEPFLRAGKAVFHVEYQKPSARLCALVSTLGVNTIFKGTDLEAPLRHC